ncbi:MAG: hypothetical protein EBX71_05915 [Betaproteobacteria bacterium]|nr:hypothetical protein [Betaproteobacteria bacterium]
MFNAYYTMLFPFYLDFRLPGVAIISFSIGLGLHSFYESWLRYKSPLAFAWFVFLAWRLYLEYSDALAKRLFRYSIWYLAYLFAALLIDHYLRLLWLPGAL